MELPQALVEFAGGAGPVVPLVQDPLLPMIPSLQNFESFAIPGIGCARSVIYCINWVVGHHMPVAEPPAVSSYPWMISYLTSNFPDFPVYVFEPVSQIMLHSFGVPRSDGLRLLFLPATRFNPAHWTLLVVPRLETRIDRCFVYYGSVPIISPNIYWHNTGSLHSLFIKRKMEGMACACATSCSCAPLRFHFATEISFSDDHAGVMSVVDYSGVHYSRGPSRSLVYRTLEGFSIVQPSAFDYPHIHDDIEEFQLDHIHIQIHLIPRNRVGEVFKLATVASFVSTMVLEFPFVRLLSLTPWYATFITSRLGQAIGCVQQSRLGQAAGCVQQAMGKVQRAMGKNPPLFSNRFYVCGGLTVALGLLSHYFSRRRVIRRPFQVLSKTWLPKTLQVAGFTRELTNRCAVGAPDRSTCLATLKRLVAQQGHGLVLNPTEVDAWLENVVTQVAQVTAAIPVGHCHCCFVKKPLKRLRCAVCRRMPVELCCYFYPSQIVGMVPLFEQHPIIPSAAFRLNGTPQNRRNVGFFEYKHNKKWTPVTDCEHAMTIYNANLPELKQQGMLCGPMILGQRIHCYPRSPYTTLVAYSVRMAVHPKHTPRPGFWVAMRDIIPFLLPPIQLEPFSEEYVVLKQKTREKREKLQQVYHSMDEGLVINSSVYLFKAFSKVEKHRDCTYTSNGMVPKLKRAPRLICNPKTELNAIMAPYVQPVTKYVASVWNCSSNIFYAGCSPPEEINSFLNLASDVNRHILEDDVSMMDGSQSEDSQGWFQHFAQACYSGRQSAHLKNMQEGIALVYIITQLIRAKIKGPNASGVPTTSVFNSVTTAVTRVHAVVYAYTGFTIFDQEFYHHLLRLLPLVYFAVAGDDGLTYLPPSYGGVETFSRDFLDRYIEAFSWSGFDVGGAKIRVFRPHNWRLATFLAMRPVWSGERYEYGVEPARRLSTMFWLLEPTMHPIAWGRGVAVSLRKASAHVPVVVDICDWYLAKTKPITTDVTTYSFTNPYSTVYGYEVSGSLNSRGIHEFMLDYDTNLSMYDDFRRYLWSHDTVLVNLDHPMLHCIFEKE